MIPPPGTESISLPGRAADRLQGWGMVPAKRLAVAELVGSQDELRASARRLLWVRGGRLWKEN